MNTWDIPMIIKYWKEIMCILDNKIWRKKILKTIWEINVDVM